MKIVSYIFAALFLASAYVQLNDPDPVIWVLIYMVAAILAVVATTKLLPWWTYFVAGALFLAGAVFQWPPHYEGVFFDDLALMRNMNIEEARESLGLAICAIANSFFGILHLKKA